MEGRSELQLPVDGFDGASGEKKRAPKNRTLTLSANDRKQLADRVISIENHDPNLSLPIDRTVRGDSLQCLPLVAKRSVDLLVLDPPYNLNKTFNGRGFSRRAVHEYTDWLEEVCVLARPLLKDTASIYICGD